MHTLNLTWTNQIKSSDFSFQQSLLMLLVSLRIAVPPAVQRPGAGLHLGLLAGRRGLLIGVIATTCWPLAWISACPRRTGKLVDAVAAGPAHVDEAWAAWATSSASTSPSPSSGTSPTRCSSPGRLEHVGTDRRGLRRVQSFSADWHADAFAGSDPPDQPGHVGL